MVNPNPTRITYEMWRLWEECPIPGVRLGGIYANKRAYHSSVNENKQKWPKDNYSIKLALDLKGPLNKARAIDLTMSEREMIKWTNNMRDSALNPADNRLAAVREFYGTLDGKTVYGLIKENLDGSWRKSTADDTHLWHGHVSVFTKFVENWEMLSPLLSVWRGESLVDWKVSGMPFPKLGDSGDDVRYWQYVHNIARSFHSDPVQTVAVDGDYGNDTASAVLAFYKKLGGTEASFKGQAITPWMAMKYHQLFAHVSAPKAPVFQEPPVLDEEQLKEIVNQWLLEHIPHNLKVTADLEGTITL